MVRLIDPRRQVCTVGYEPLGGNTEQHRQDKMVRKAYQRDLTPNVRYTPNTVYTYERVCV